MENTAVEPVAETTHDTNILAPDVSMLILTWITFFILFAILKKFAWKPILEALQKREDYIRKSLDDADRARQELVGVEATKAKILDDAKVQASQIIQDSRTTASALAVDIESQAKKHAADILNSAKAQIEGERERVMGQLKLQVVDTSIKLAEKVLRENLDVNKNRQLIQQALDKDMV